MATDWREWPIIRQEAIYQRLTPVQQRIVDRLLVRGWEIGHLYHRSLSMCRQRTMWLKRCPIKITPSGKITKG